MEAIVGQHVRSCGGMRNTHETNTNENIAMFLYYLYLTPVWTLSEYTKILHF